MANVDVKCDNKRCKCQVNHRLISLNYLISEVLRALLKGEDTRKTLEQKMCDTNSNEMLPGNPAVTL